MIDEANSYGIFEDEARMLVEICEWEGFESIDSLISHFSISSVMPGACTKCSAITTSVEPDQRAGWCHNCEKESVQSVLVLAGLC